MMAVRLLVAVCVVAAVGVSAHKWGWGSCQRVDPTPNLNLDQFLNQWYVVEQFDTTSTCLTMNYTRVSPTQLKVTKSRQLVLLDSLSIEHTNSYTGTLDIPDGDKPAKMRAKWPLDIAGKSDYVVFDTDGQTYAAIFDCQQITSLMNRYSAAILSRTPSLPAETISKIKQLLQSFNVDPKHFDKIDHSVCIRREDSDLNINIDENTFKKLISGASENFQTIATQLVTIFQVANGANNFANTVVDFTKQLGASTDGTNDTNAAVKIDKEAEVIP
ncbi:apolipoprotein D [Procambarus clarkii]|uniref:apolipoprotein D n=1 Tax=Procambarus clarkii TaxID=6728 RepID=UPI003743528A